MPADPVDAVVAAFRAEGMKGDDELVERFARVAVETCERDTERLREAAQRVAAHRCVTDESFDYVIVPAEDHVALIDALAETGERDG